MTVYDLATPPSQDGSATQSTAPPQNAMAQPQQQDIVKKVAAVLLLGYGASKTVQLLATLLAPYGISGGSLALAYKLATRGTAHKPNGRPGSIGLKRSTDAMRGAAASEVYFRAGFIVQSAKRIEKSTKKGNTIRATMDTEENYYREHEKARKVRLDIAAKTQKAANVYGNMLGWYLNPTLNNEEECIAANGNNFYADKGTLIGYPGSVHPNCGCTAGPPHEDGGMVDDAVKFIVKRNKAQEVRTYRMKRVN